MPEKPTVTLKDIAAQAGVSVMTVSRVLTGKGQVSAEKSAIVRAAAERLGYQPNPMLGQIMSHIRRGRATACTGNLGWINTHLDRREWRDLPYRRHLLEGAIERAAQLGFSLDEFWAHEPGITPARFQQILLSRGIQGLLVAPSSPAQSGLLASLDLSRFAVGFLSPPEVPGQWSWVESDDHMAIASAVNAVRRAGYVRPGLVLARLQDTQGWRPGFLALQQDWPEESRIPVLRLPGALAEHPRLYQDWLRLHRPDVVIGCDHRLKPLAEEAGFAVPGRLALVHLHLAEDVEGWAGIDPRDQWVGHAAVELVAASLRRNERGQPAFPQRILVPSVWRDGATLPPRGA